MPRNLSLGLLLPCLVAASASGADTFRQDVAPLFERYCVRCHSGEEPKGGLDLTTGKGLIAGGESGAVVVAGKPDESQLIESIAGEKPEMPKDATPLSAVQVEAVRRWIAEGAIWPDGLVLADKRAIDANWWSLGPLAGVKVPELADTWVRTPVDAFVLAKLREKNLAPSPEADRRTLIRRLTYDLHGLPPTPEEIEEFLADASDGAYDGLVDRLLDSPRYGERFARYWLDIVHFGESHGYDKDKPRPNAWPYRDWVIRSLNHDKPYDRFAAEQIAGDVLCPDDPQATVATGFIAAGPWDFVGHAELREGTTDKDIARSNDRDDMVAGAMSTFVSLTVHCARCHDHKFDPIRQQDYYALQAVFAGVDRADRPYDADASVTRRRAELVVEKARLEGRLSDVRKEIEAITSEEIAALDQQIAAWKGELAAMGDAQSSNTLGYHCQIVPQEQATKWVQVDLGEATLIDEIVLVPAHVKYGNHSGPGFGFPLRFKIEVADNEDFAASRVVADHTEADYAHPGDDWQRFAASGARARYVRVTATKLWRRTDDWIFALAELMVMSKDQDAALGRPVRGLDSIEAAPSWTTANLVDGFGSQARIVAEDRTLSQHQVLADKLRRAAGVRSSLVEARLDQATRADLAAAKRGLSDVQNSLEALPKQQMVYAATHQFTAQGSFTPPAGPRPVYLLARGDVRNRGELIAPAGVACVHGPEPRFEIGNPNDEGLRRAALAHWLVDPRNALLRRSIVNRVWQFHFGQGIVDTPNDFGRMGSLPSHPELLDWLAGWFAGEGHSLKKLHRLLVTSAVYRQQSPSRADGATVDAGNRLLWRMNAARLDAECVRDAMLAVSGKLDLTMGGPSVQQFLFKDDHSPIYDYTQFNVDDARSNRRSIYRFLVRSVPDPFMECLDCADPSIMTPKRNTTLTSLQALALLNNPLAVRQAEHFAERLRAMHGEPARQIEAGFLLAFGRRPSDEECAALVNYAQKHGLANACRVLFNSNEFVFVD